MNGECERWIAEAETTHALTREQLTVLLADETSQDALAAAADRVRQRFVGNAVHLRGLIEFSNVCCQNCLYCGLRRDNFRAERYRLEEEEIVALAEQARAAGYQTVVMQSGEDAYFTVDRLTAILRRIKALGLAITLSIGEKSRAEYAAYRTAGADRYLLRIETTDRALYARLHPGMSFENRLRCLRDLRELGYAVGTGCLIGLPGQRLSSLAEDLLLFQALDADMIGAGPFIPNGDTPLRDAAGGTLALSLRFVALLRLLLPDSNIPATTALETLDPGARLRALQGGANVVMPNVTAGECRRKYALYPGKAGVDDSPERSREVIGAAILGIGRRIAAGRGDRRPRELE